MSRPAVSRHLRVLREAGLVSANGIGRQQQYRLNRAALASSTRLVRAVHAFEGRGTRRPSNGGRIARASQRGEVTETPAAPRGWRAQSLKSGAHAGR
ncbi:MAG: hypothetical protein DMF89_23505 [Acidobacteria bacterium]|nr:MAG: hypothetical protein DMF90_08720 [Acidobacteriota bacterium]PYR46005.1 MAG: hypothetical protein DMF89_23505 [Acidobacteriota bacterium]